ncbi:4'-phosphopantetheinyl transferase [Streptomyces sp. NPDC058739]|uniref:4'-phosphopantetheinyl transferase family protein n=1 Tax=Streptomyces sp. NPDC058739 TaxID=3346618 RepID=UPI0036CCBF89
MLAGILPAGAATAETRAGELPDSELFPEERALITRALPKRRAEFTSGRGCAHRALTGLGLAPVPVLRGPKREPLWPAGVTGSLTHCHGYRAAAVARQSDYASIGIDAEEDKPLPEGVVDRIALPAERAQLTRPGGPHWDTLLFSAKESVYKAWFPLTGRWLGFEDAYLTLHPGGTFEARLLVAGPLRVFHGNWVARDGLLITAIAHSAAQRR